MKIKCHVISVSRRVSKNGKDYVSVTLGFPGFEKCSFFLDERLVPDFVEGKDVLVEFELTFKNFKPDLKIKGVVR